MSSLHERIAIAFGIHGKFTIDLCIFVKTNKSSFYPWRKMCASLFSRESEKLDGVGVAQMFPIFIGNSWTKGGPVVENLTGMVQDEEGNLPDQRRRIFAGKCLEDGRILDDYNVQTEEEVHVAVCLQGGMYHFSSGRDCFDRADERRVSLCARFPDLGPDGRPKRGRGREASVELAGEGWQGWQGCLRPCALRPPAALAVRPLKPSPAAAAAGAAAYAAPATASL